MSLKSQLSIAPVSGFVAFDGGGAVIDSYRAPATARVVVEQPALPVALPSPGADASVFDGMRQSATWHPAGAARSRRVEGAVIIAICGYFVFGFASLAHWI